MCKNEIPIKGFEHYLICPCGNIRADAVKYKILKPNKGRIVLNLLGKSKSISVKKLVLDNF